MISREHHSLWAGAPPRGALVPSLLVALASLVLSACPGDGGQPDAGPGTGTFTIGQRVNPGVCEEDVDCPPDYACRAGQCRQIDNDLDNDGYDSSVDCDDNDPSIHPGAEEVCDGVDNNCSGVIDEGVLNACGFCGPVPEEVCDLIDNDCDGLVDEDCSAGGAEEVEPNDGAANCQPIALPPNEGESTVLSGAFDPPGDKDSFCFFVRQGTRLLFDLDSQVLGAATDGVLQLFGENGAQLPGGYNDYFQGPDPQLDYTFNFEGNVRLDVYNFENTSGGPGHIYDLHITAVSLIECLDEDGDGVSVCDGDCRDDDIMIFPNQTEICDGIDNNCDGEIDEGCADLTRTEREPNNSLQQCEILMPPFTIKGVINPAKDDDYFCFFAPGGMKMGFDIDAKEDSDSLLDSYLRLHDFTRPQLTIGIEWNDDGIDPDTGYTAVDSDSYLEYTFTRPGMYAIQVEDSKLNAGGARLTYTLHGNVLTAPECTDADADGVSTCEGDCNDNDPAVHFGAVEICDGKDNNCDGVKDFPACTGDFDGDGYSGLQGDCDDSDPTVHPGATEVCDGIDNNCDGQIDEGVKNACGTCGFPPAEVCDDGIDNDCDGEIDEPDCAVDADGDGFTPGQGDCDDTNPAVHPDAVEVCNGIDDNCNGLIDEYVKNSCGVCGEDPPEICDGLDNNCNGLIDDGVLNACGYCGPPPVEICDGIDNNCDGHVDEGLLNACGECGEEPLEVCDGIDNDCDGDVDEGCDADLDGDGMTWREGDCDDGDATVYHGAPEVCGDGKDNDCNGVIDDAPPCAVPAEVEPNNTVAACNRITWPGRITGAIPTGSDVDVYCFSTTVPNTEIGIDVDAQVLGSPLDAKFAILRADGSVIREVTTGNDPQTPGPSVDPYNSHTFEEPGDYAVRISAQAINTAGPDSTYELELLATGGCLDLDRDGFTTCAGDCNDYDSSIHPGAVDVCDGATVDNNCDGTADERCWGDCLDDRFKGNHSVPSAAPIAAGYYPELFFCGNVGAADLFKVDLTAGQSIGVEISFDHAVTDLTLRALSPQLQQIDISESEANNEAVLFTVSQTGTHYFEINGPFGAVGGYEMVVNIIGGSE